MVLARGLAMDQQRLLEQRQGPAVLALGIQAEGQPVVRPRGVDVLFSQRLAAEGQRLLEQRLCLDVLALARQGGGQVVVTARGVGVLLPQHLAANGQGLAKLLLGLARTALGVELHPFRGQQPGANHHGPVLCRHPDQLPQSLRNQPGLERVGMAPALPLLAQGQQLPRRLQRLLEAPCGFGAALLFPKGSQLPLLLGIEPGRPPRGRNGPAGLCDQHQPQDDPATLLGPAHEFALPTTGFDPKRSIHRRACPAAQQAGTGDQPIQP